MVPGKFPEFVEARRFANTVSPAINLWEEESFGDFTVNPEGLLFTREAPFFTYTDSSGKQALVQIDPTSDPIQIEGIYTRLDENWWGADCYEIHSSSHSPADNKFTPEELIYPRIKMRWNACPEEDNFGKLVYIGYEIAPGKDFHFYFGKDGQENRHSTGEDPGNLFAPPTLVGERTLLGREILWEIDVASKAVEIIKVARFMEFLVATPVRPE